MQKTGAAIMLSQPSFKDTISLLAKLFPKTFFVDGKQRRPLKANITDDVERGHHPDLEDISIGPAVDYY
jgi:hypothetical protein